MVTQKVQDLPITGMEGTDYETIGGVEMIDEVVSKLLELAQPHEGYRQLLEEIGPERLVLLRDYLAQQLCVVTGGPVVYRRGDAYDGRPGTEPEIDVDWVYQSFTGLLQAALDKARLVDRDQKVGEPERKKLRIDDDLQKSILEKMTQAGAGTEDPPLYIALRDGLSNLPVETQYWQLGGIHSIRLLSVQFFVEVKQIVGQTVRGAKQEVPDPFANTRATQRRLMEMNIQNIAASCGGPFNYMGRSLVETHGPSGVTEPEFYAIVRAMELALQVQDPPIAPHAREQLLGLMRSVKSDVVGIPTVKPKMGESNEMGGIRELTMIMKIRDRQLGDPMPPAEMVRVLLSKSHRSFNDPDGPLYGFGTVHDARAVLIDGGTRLLFATTYDGTWDEYINMFLKEVWPFFEAVLPLLEGGREVIAAPKGPTPEELKDGREVPAALKGSTREDMFKEFIRTHQIRAEAFFVGYPKGSTVKKIREALTIADAWNGLNGLVALDGRSGQTYQLQTGK